jgi:hypothetical protein
MLIFNYLILQFDGFQWKPSHCEWFEGKSQSKLELYQWNINNSNQVMKIVSFELTNDKW